MSIESPQEYYATQSSVTDPVAFAYLYDALPHTPADLSHIVQGLILHYVAERHLYNYPPERTTEIDTRYASAILRRLLELDNSPLDQTRSPEKRFIGCCRDFTLLAVSILRHFGIPARARHGFANYLIPGVYMDHVVVEYWDGTAWILWDSEMPARLDINVFDLPRDRFVVGGLAWQMARSGQVQPELFCIIPDLPINGFPFIQSRLMQDLAALNKTEMLCWDEWYNEDDPVAIDLLAEVTQHGDAGFTRWRQLFMAGSPFALPRYFSSFSPAHPDADLPIRLSLDSD